MRYGAKIILAITFIYIYVDGHASVHASLPPEEAKNLVKNAVVYALENTDPNMDYSKFVSKNFKNPIDGNIFNYEQWVAHQKHIKKW